MKKTGIIILMITFVIVNTSNITYADTDLDKQRTEFVDVSDKLKTLDSELTKVSQDISVLNESISNNEASIHSTETEIQNADSKIKSLQDEIDANKKSLSIRLREMYKNNSFSGFNYVKFIFQSRSITDLFNRINACNIVINEDKKLIDGIKSDVEDVNEVKEEINKKQASLISLNEQTKSKLNEVKEKEDKLNETKAKLDKEKEALRDTIKGNEYKLIKSDIDNINKKESYSKVASAIKNLKDLIKHLTIDEVIASANTAISNGEAALSTLTKENVSDNIIATYTMEATAYCASPEAYTSGGNKPIRDPNGISTVAVDTHIIPYGTKLLIPGYGYAVADDTGGAINGMKIDLFMNTEKECTTFGRKSITVYILA